LEALELMVGLVLVGHTIALHPQLPKPIDSGEKSIVQPLEAEDPHTIAAPIPQETGWPDC
jgi:hypothetical protein